MNHTKKRLCIYLTYDKQQRIDSYIGYMLKELKSCVDHLVVVCNETEILSGREILGEYADEIFCRENLGFDAGGFKDALCEYISWDRVWKYDELILVNDSMFGPFRPMKEIFSEMDGRGTDFWGLTVHAEAVTENLGHIPEHIQSFFLVIGSNMLHSDVFRAYWEDMPYYSTLVETVRQHELRFTRYFANQGFTYDSLADTRANDSVACENNYSQYVFLSFEMIVKRNFPFLKKQHIPLNTLYWQTQENLRLALDYIDRETDYDADLIWENIIRIFDASDLQRSLHLQYILPSGQDNSLQTCTEGPERVLIAFFVSYAESAGQVSEALLSTGFRDCVRIFSETEECLTAYRKHGFSCRIIRKNEIARMLAEFGCYDFVCVLQDADMTSGRRPSCVGKSLFYNMWENLIQNKTYISRVLDCFRKEKRLGFLTPPPPNFEKYFGSYKREWDGRFKTVWHIADKLDLNCRISVEKPPFLVTDYFWIRGSILKKLSGMDEIDADVLPWLWTYLAQDAGCYSGIVESEEYASINEVNLQYYLRQIGQQVRKQYGDFDTFSEMTERIRLSALRVFCKKYSRLLVYGTGEMAEKYREHLQEIEAYVVSDGQARQETLHGRPVKYLSEIAGIRDYGIILCLNEKNQAEVIPLLKQHKILHYFCM